MVGICLFYIYSLVENLKAGLTHTHLLLNAKFGNGRVLRRALPTENLPTCPTVVLNEEPPAVMHFKLPFMWYFINTIQIDCQRSNMYLSGHNTKLNPTSVTVLRIHPLRCLEEKHDKPITNQTSPSALDILHLLNSYSHPFSCKHGIALLEFWEDMT